MIWLIFFLSSAFAAEDFEIIEKGADKEAVKISKPAGVVQLSDEFYPGFSINSAVNFSGNFRTGAVEAVVEETFKMSDGGVNVFILIPVTLNQYRPGDTSERNTPRIGGGPLPIVKFGFEVYRNNDSFGEAAARIFLPFDSSNRMRFGVMMMGSYKHRFILGHWVIDGTFSAGTSFSKEISNSSGSSIFVAGGNTTTEQEPVFNSSLEFFPSYLLSDSLALLFGGVWSYRAPSRATQNGAVVYSQNAENNAGLGLGVRWQTGKSSYLNPLFYRIVAPPETEDRNNFGLMMNWLIYI